MIVLRGRGVAPDPQRAPLLPADGDGRGAAAREPPEGLLPPERQPRAAHAADVDRRLDGPARGAVGGRGDAAARVEAGAPVGPGAARPDRRPARPRAAGPRNALSRSFGVSLADVVARSIETVRLMAEGRGRGADPGAAARVDARGPRRRPAAPAGPLEPSRERDQIHAAPRAGHRPGRAGAAALSRERRGRRDRDPGEASCRTSSSGSARRTDRRRGGTPGWASGSPSPAPWSSCTAAPSGPTARRDTEAASRFRCRSRRRDTRAAGEGSRIGRRGGAAGKRRSRSKVEVGRR